MTKTNNVDKPRYLTNRYLENDAIKTLKDLSSGVKIVPLVRGDFYFKKFFLAYAERRIIMRRQTLVWIANNPPIHLNGATLK